MPPSATVLKRKIRLRDFATDEDGGLTKPFARRHAKTWTKRIGQLQEQLYADAHHAVLLIFQGLDASGKDGAIRRVLRYVNPAGVETTSFKVPSETEKAHDFLWRVHAGVPRCGLI